MASLLPESLFEVSGPAPPPNKDFYYFSVSKSEVIWRWWKISLRVVYRFSRPGEQRVSHQDFLCDASLQSEVRMVFGQKIFQYAKALCQGHYDYLERLPDPFLLQIMSHLELEDVGQLGRTSRRFKKLCESEEFWEQVVHQRCTTVSAEVASLAQELGWRSVFFCNKLQLQKLLHRRRLKVPDPDVEAKESAESSEPDPTPASEEESLSASLGHLCTGFGRSSDPNREADVGFDSAKLKDGLTSCEVETSGVGDCCAEPAKS